MEENLRSCNCTYSCPRKGICCECIEHHRRKRQLPACFFTEEAERTYDRSFEFFAELVNSGKV
ncbi:MAG: DUF6485 family protein [Fidelibacterota bacterium]